ncbi:MAG TPA: ABC transporter permease [Terriglobales bacterium]|nr:ABC transporter permease [Terriglobales bacterium]
MEFKDILLQSWDSLVRNRLRSILTMLGIVWGLVTVVLLLGYGQSVGNSVVGAFMGIGNNVCIMWAGQTSMQAGGQRAGKRIFFEYEDAQAIRDEVPLVKNVSVESNSIFGFKNGNKVISVSSKMVQFPYGEMRKLKVAEGRYFEDGDFVERRRVVIMGPNAAKKVFGQRSPVGEYVTVLGQQFLVIGVLELKIQDASNNGPDNENAFFPFETVRSIANFKFPDMIVFQPVSPEKDTETMDAVRAVLARRHNFHPKDDKATPTWNTIENSVELMKFSVALQAVLGFIGALTLGVGGVGVMNIMLVSVTERTKEVGIRKALGARPRDIAWQFLTESLVLTFIAGAIGMLASVAIANMIPPMPLYSEQFKTANNEGDIILKTSVSVMVSAFLILTSVGIFSGMWPAMKAAKMDPVDSLRYE